MKKSNVLKSERASLIEAVNTILSAIESESRDMTDSEFTQFEDLQSQIETKNAEIAKAEKIEVAQASRAATSFTRKDDEGQARKRFSFQKMIKEMTTNGGLTGLEKEMYEEAQKEARDAGVTLEGQGAIPKMLIAERAPTTAATSAGVIQTDKFDNIELLRPVTVLEQMGARVLTGLSGNIDLRKQSDNSVAQWGTEIADAPESDFDYTAVNMSPKRLSHYIDVSKTLLAQASLNVEQLIVDDMRRAVEQALEAAAISGATGGANPVGILNFVNLQSAFAGNAATNQINANGAALIWEDIVKLESLVANTNKADVSMGYLINSKTRGALKTTLKDQGSGRFVYEGGPTPLNEYQVGMTNLVPSTITKGNRSDLSAVIFGDFNDLYIGNWAGLDLVVDPYTQGRKSVVRVIVAAWYDVVARRQESFAAIKDAIA